MHACMYDIQNQKSAMKMMMGDDDNSEISWGGGIHGYIKIVCML